MAGQKGWGVARMGGQDEGLQKVSRPLLNKTHYPPPFRPHLPPLKQNPLSSPLSPSFVAAFQVSSPLVRHRIPESSPRRQKAQVVFRFRVS
ncbi:hypothetical protein L6452_34002 [Arctium lappa]|uniref:Uncharacterized protein n=1 Tax=Arctium lappa TaxID=4217 RepID=A0ACB8YI56_ARCLA|nr:hypothetical protein L6452_34002 [Arctium lappa]